MKDKKFIRRALMLAARGGRAVSPNPMVGAVIVKNDRIIGEGWHKKFGGSHAEANAIRSVRHTQDLSGATLYVTLEPCQHWGKTPPCTEAIEKVGIKRVVAGSHDPFQKRITNYELPITFLKESIAQQCQELNKFFFTWVTKKRPYITAKIAVSADGFVAGLKGKPVRITNKVQDRLVHQLRAQHQAIMVGVNTVIADDPLLTVRHAKGADPLRVILDSKLRIPRNARVLKDKNYIIATTQRHSRVLCHSRENGNLDPRLRGDDNVWISPTQKQVNLKKLLAHLAKQGISSVLVEPGPTLYASLKKAGLIDELIIL
ncbi:MAG: bifunctional diaminohydroxyphosphoribosylaminopyrimidine deaminase/5-amino-6-(5-phosphoribosylamino)uracil reductase RibD, partial [Candidatus Peregrinibacteria bacterium]